MAVGGNVSLGSWNFCRNSKPSVPLWIAHPNLKQQVRTAP